MLRNPTNAGDRRLPRLQRRDRPDARPRRRDRRRRAGGLAAAVYGASEGLDVLVLESNAPGGQAGSSSRIENYLGFPTGISGQELAGARLHAGAEVRRRRCMIAKGATAAHLRAQAVRASRSTTARACRRATVIIATGARVPAAAARQPVAVRGRRRLLRRDVHRGAALRRRRGDRRRRRQLRRPGGGVPRADRAGACTCSCASGGLADSMSRYLIRRIEENPAIDAAHAHRDRRRSKATTTSSACAGATTQTGDDRDARHPARVRHDRRRAEHGAGSTAASRSTPRASSRPDPTCRATIWRRARWPLAAAAATCSRRACPACSRSATSRGGNIKRVASAVGEGSIAVSFVHQVLHE